MTPSRSGTGVGRRGRAVESAGLGERPAGQFTGTCTDPNYYDQAYPWPSQNTDFTSIQSGASLLGGAILGLAPALHAGRLDVIRMIKQEGRGSPGSREQVRTRRALVVTEFALSLMLMVAATLLARSFWDLANVGLGVNPERVMTVRTRLPYPNDPKNDRYATVAQETPFLRDILRRSRSLPGVDDVAAGNLGAVPLGHDRNNQTPPVPLILEGRTTPGDQPYLVDGSTVTPNYFSLMGMTLLRGRVFTDGDNETEPDAAVINEAMAQLYWPHGDPLGQHLKLSQRATSWTTIVGVVADARTESLQDARVPQVYISVYQHVTKHLAIFLRGHLDAAAIPDQVREQVQLVDATLPVFGAEMLNDTVAASLAERRFAMEIVALFALTALSLAGLGIYGVLSFIVGERTHEIGIRLALGAHGRTIVRMILREGVSLAVAGTAIGLVGALVLSRLMTGLLYGVRPTDPLTFAGVALLLLAVAVCACYIPARRATRVDPIVALSSR
jgi:predicted permease